MAGQLISSSWSPLSLETSFELVVCERHEAEIFCLLGVNIDSFWIHTRAPYLIFSCRGWIFACAQISRPWVILACVKCRAQNTKNCVSMRSLKAIDN